MFLNLAPTINNYNGPCHIFFISKIWGFLAFTLTKGIPTSYWMIFSLGSMVSKYAINHILVPGIYSERFIVKSFHLAKSMNCIVLSLISCQVD